MRPTLLLEAPALFGPMPPLPVGLEGALPTGPIIAGLFELDALAVYFSTLVLFLTVLLVIASPASRQALRYSVIAVFFLILGIATLSATSLLLFYIAWELSALFAWGLARLTDDSVGAEDEVAPFNAAGAIGSLLMFGAVLYLALVAGKTDPRALGLDLSTPLGMAVLAAVLLKVFGVLSDAFGASGRNFPSLAGATLSSVTLIVIGVYPFFRFFGQVGTRPPSVEVTLTLAGLALLALIAALAQTDIFRALSLGALGQILGIFAVVLLSPTIASGATLSAITNVILVFAALYLLLGVVEATSGQRELSKLGGAASSQPVVALLFALGALLLSGLAPFGGQFWAVGLFGALVRGDASNGALIIGAVLVLNLAYLSKLFFGIFFGPRRTVSHSLGSLPTVLIAALLIGLTAHQGLTASVIAPGPTVDNNLLLLLIVFPLSGALVVYLGERLFSPIGRYIGIAALFVQTILGLGLLFASRGEALFSDFQLSGLSLSLPMATFGPQAVQGDYLFSTDPGRALTLLLACLLQLIIYLFATGYVERGRTTSGIFALQLATAGPLTALILADNLFALAASLGLVGLTIGVLVAASYSQRSARSGRMVFLVFGLVSTLALLGPISLSASLPATAIDGLIGALSKIDGSIGSATVALIALGALSAITGLPPFQGWLIGSARHTLPPTTALMVGVVAPIGLLTLLRATSGLNPEGAAPLSAILFVAGAFGTIFGAIGAARSKEVRTVLASAGISTLAMSLIGIAFEVQSGASGEISTQTTLSLALSSVGVVLAILGVSAALQSARTDRIGQFEQVRLRRRFESIAGLIGVCLLVGVPPLPTFGARAHLIAQAITVSSSADSLPRLGLSGLGALAVAISIAVGTLLLVVSLSRLIGLGPAALDSLAGRLPIVARSALGLLALVSLLAIFVPEEALRVGLTGAPGRATAVWSELVGGIALLLALVLGTMPRLAALGLLPKWAEKANRTTGRVIDFLFGLFGRTTRDGRTERPAPESIDLIGALDGLLRVVAWVASALFDSTLGRLGRRA